MAKHSKAKPGRTAGQPKETRDRQPKRAAHSGDVSVAMLAVAVAVWARAPWLTPLLLTAPLAFYLARGAAADPEARYNLFRRWAITVLITTIAATAFAPMNAIRAVPWGDGAVTRIQAWMSGDAGPPLGALYMLVAGAAYLAGTALSAGIVGALVYSSVLALNAVYATILFSKGYNVLQIAFVAISPWQWCFLVGLFVLFTPLSMYSRQSVLARDGEPFSWDEKRRTMMVGAALLLAAFLLRFLLAGLYASLVRNWTVY
jgi:hypothetical protein